MQRPANRERDFPRLLRDDEDESIRQSAQGQRSSMASSEQSSMDGIASLSHHGQEDPGGHDPCAPHDDCSVVQRAARMEEALEQVRRELRVDAGASLDVLVEGLLPLDDDESTDPSACQPSQPVRELLRRSNAGQEAAREVRAFQRVLESVERSAGVPHLVQQPFHLAAVAVAGERSSDLQQQLLQRFPLAFGARTDQFG